METEYMKLIHKINRKNRRDILVIRILGILLIINSLIQLGLLIYEHYH